jgi:hypothetical protein
MLQTLCQLLLVSTASANFLSYLDENGTKHIVQSETEIPEKYRSSLKVTSLGVPKNSSHNSAGGVLPEDPSLSARATCLAKVNQSASDNTAAPTLKAEALAACAVVPPYRP